MKNLIAFKQNTRAFTLIELLVVIAIIGMLASVVLASLNDARARAEDARRLQDMQQIRTALELFHQDFNRYPGSAEGISGSGVCIGIGGPFDVALEPYLSPVPRDPKHDAGDCTSVASANFFYAYDPAHAVDWCTSDTSDDATGIVFGFFTAEQMTGLQTETCGGGDMKLNNANYNVAIFN